MQCNNTKLKFQIFIQNPTRNLVKFVTFKILLKQIFKYSKCFMTRIQNEKKFNRYKRGNIYLPKRKRKWVKN